QHGSPGRSSSGRQRSAACPRRSPASASQAARSTTLSSASPRSSTTPTWRHAIPAPAPPTKPSARASWSQDEGAARAAAYARPVKLFVHELRAEQLLFWRNREAAIFTFFLPVIFFLIFGSIYGNSKLKGGIRGANFLEAGMIGYGVAATCFAGLGITLVIRRESGILKRIRATPL